MIDTLSEANSKAILQQLLKEEKVSEDDLLTYLHMNPSNEMKRMVDFMHLMFCVGDHQLDCEYDVEGQKENPWQWSNHQLWLAKTTAMMRELGVASEHEFRTVYGHAQKLVIMYHDMEIEKPAALALALKLLGLTKVSTQIELTSSK